MNTQEAIDKIKQITARETFMSEIIWVKRDDVIEIVKQLDEPVKAILNEEEAEWLERLKKSKSFLNCLYIITRQGWGHDFEFYVHEEKYKLSYRDDNDEDSVQTKNRLVNALLYGYEVEKEKLYTVELPNPQSSLENVHIMLVKTANDRVVISEIADSHVNLRNDIKLTEAEIKKDFDWAWQFAEGVTK